MCILHLYFLRVFLIRFDYIPFGMGDADSRSLRSDGYGNMHHFVRRSTSPMFPFDVFGEVRLEFMQCFLLLFMLLWVPIFVKLCKREALMLWHAFLFFGLMHVEFPPPCSFLLGGLHFLFL
jgi:hypothetical protein